MIKRLARVLPQPIKRLVRPLYRRMIGQAAAAPAPAPSQAAPARGRPEPIDMPKVTSMADDSGKVLQCCIAYNQYGGYCVPLNSRYRPVAQKVLRGRVHEPETIEFIRTQYRGGDIVHAGTYFGDFLPALSKVCASGAKVWAFEPHPENYRCTGITIIINDLQNVALMKAGLGAQPETREIIFQDEEGKALGGASYISDSAATRGVPVEIIRLDDVIPQERRISVLHLDVEGFEQYALAGSLQLIRRCLPVIIVEHVPDADWLAEHLFPLGYRVAQKVHNNTVLSRE